MHDRWSTEEKRLAPREGGMLEETIASRPANASNEFSMTALSQGPPGFWGLAEEDSIKTSQTLSRDVATAKRQVIEVVSARSVTYR